jgi:amino acid adenylation domain-containing protein
MIDSPQLNLKLNNMTVDYPERNGSLHSLIEEQVLRTPGQVALVFENENVSYRELNERSNQLAHYLRKQGVGPNVFVGICAERSIEMVLALLAILKSGGAYVPLDPEYPTERLAMMIEDSQTPGILTQQKLLGHLSGRDTPTFCLDTDWKALASESTLNPNIALSPSDAAYAIYTSGSTGKPKGVVNVHQGIVNRLLWMQDAYRLTSKDRVLQKTPYSFDVSVWEFFWPLMTGARLVIARPGGHRDPRYLADVISREKITTLHFVPSMLRSFLEAVEIPKRSTVRQIFCSGEALPADLQHQFFSRVGADLYNLYGPTEAAVDVTHWTCRRDDKRSFVPIGRPIANIEIYILDEQLQPTPAGTEGELHIGGIGLARGYLNRPELTAEKFIRNPFSNDPNARLYKTGDLARFLPSGDVEYLGRLDYQVKIRGFRIELGEIEVVIGRYPSIRQVVVVAREDAPGDKRLVAYIVPAQIGQFETARLLEFLKSQLPDYMIPVVIVLEAMPLSANGKVDRKALPAASVENHLETHDFIAARNEIEKGLVNIWSDLLAIQKIGIKDNFFELGGHSLLAIRLVSRIEQSFGKELSLASLLEAQTIEQQADLILGRDGQGQPGRDETNSAQDHSTQLPFFFLGGDATFLPLSQGLRAAHGLHSLGMQASFVQGGKDPLSLPGIADHFVRAIRARQPQGPYMLAGWCAHGLLALEIAQQLREEGDEIALLMMIEVTHPIRRKEYPQWKTLVSTTQLKWHLLKFEYAYLGQVSRAQQFRYIAGRLSRKASRIRQSMWKWLRSSSAADGVRSDRSPVEALYGAVESYQPKPYRGPVVLFRSIERTFGFAKDLRLGWGNALGNELEICESPGNHYTIYMEPNVGELVRKIMVQVERAEARSSRPSAATIVRRKSS